MNPIGKKFVTLFLVISLLATNCSSLRTLERKREKGRKHGAVLIIQKKDGRQIKGELITVKQNSLLLLDSATGADVSTNVNYIKVIKILKRSKIWEGIKIGGLTGALCGLLLSLTNSLPWQVWPTRHFYWWGAMLGGFFGGVLGGGVYAFAGADKTIQIEGMSDSEIQETLDELSKKARIRDYK